ncbi:hypothetical protein QQ054_00155 [Oscillatoria amoena NRMC-F 0135]|nr:hypothetical protein [Oscillatoria amoena NRMC-F 0135]
MIVQEIPGIRVLGPGEPMVSRIRNQYLMNMLIKIPRDSGNLSQIKATLSQLGGKIQAAKAFRSLRIIMDVDPV